MKGRWPLWLAISVPLSASLCWALVARSGLDGHAFLARLGGLKPAGLAAMVGLIGVSTWLSALRWRRIQSEDPPSRVAAFALTALGVGVGQVLPVQLASALSRSLGGRLFGDRRPVRTALITVYEQGFDLLLMLALGAASAAALAAGSPRTWPALALAAGVLTAGAALLAPRIGERIARLPGRLGTAASRLQDKGLVSPRTTLPLLLLTAGRFAILVAMAAITTWSAGLSVSPLALAAALPLVALATAAPLTPAGFGVNEWTFAAVLVAFGTPLSEAAQWALMNRVLVASASIAVALVGAAAGLAAAPARSPVGLSGSA